MRIVTGFAVALWAAAAAAEPGRLTQEDCRAGQAGPCIVGLAADVVKACEDAPDAELVPFAILAAVIGTQPEGHAPGHYVWRWMRAAAVATGAAHGLDEGPTNRLAPVGDSGFEDWSPEGLVARGWIPGDTVRFAVPLHPLDHGLAGTLPTIEAPVFCGAWVQEAGIAEPPDVAGAWVWGVREGDAPAACPAANLQGDGAGPAPGPVVIFTPGGRVLISDLWRRAGLSIGGGGYPRHVTRGRWETEGAVLRFPADLNYAPPDGRYVITAADAGTMTLRPVTGALSLRSWHAPVTLRRCDLGMTPDEALDFIPE